jgi:hypothetical protein
MTPDAKWLHHVGFNNLAFWSEKWTLNISKSCQKNIHKI